MPHTNTTALITGGASGIGEGLARIIIEGGGKAVICDWNGDGAKALAEELGENALAISCDVSDVAATEAMVTQAWDWAGGLTHVFANAGIGLNRALLKATEQEFDLTMGVNLKGVWATLIPAAKLMIEAGTKGHLCMTGSEHSIGFQHAGNGFYTASKHAVLGFADVLRHELPEALSVHVLLPGLTATNMPENRKHTPLGPGRADATAFGQAVMAEGLPAREVAQMTLDGMARGDFLIVTAAASYPPAERRAAEIKAAYDAQAPMTEDAMKYDVDTVIARVRGRLT